MKPIIGILAKHYKNENERQNTFIRDEVKNAIIYNGGIPIGILPTDSGVVYTSGDRYDDFMIESEKEDLITQLKLCDGIVIQGGAESDMYEIFVSKFTYDNDIPTLGICAGQNNMVRGVGGTTKKVSNPEKHSKLWTELVHDIYVDRNSNFYKIVQKDKMSVNSRHKNTIDKPTEHYKVVATDDDGNIEVLEAPDKKFNLAVRFHPESLYKNYSEHNSIIKAFVDVCKS